MGRTKSYRLFRETKNKIVNIGASLVLVATSIGGGLPLLLTNTANATAAPTVVYDALPSVSPATNYASQPFQAQQTDEVGDYVHLTSGDRTLDTVTVTMSNWAKFSDYSSNPAYSGDNTNWTHPVTVNVYGNHLGSNGAPDEKIATLTKSISIPWRPEGDPSCGDTSNGKGWKTGGTCYDYSGLAFNASFDLSSQNVVLPDDIIVGIAFNTQTWGYSPIGTPGPYNSLNVAVPSGQTASIGSDDSSDAVFWNTHTCGYYSIPGSCNVFRKDTGWAPNGTVALKVTASPVDTSSTQFVGDPKYVRQNNGGDLTAQIVTPDTTQDVRFYIDGNTSTSYPGSNVGGAGATTSWWRLYTPLAAGQHTISAQVKIVGHWYDVTDTGLVYSLDAPWAQYVLPGVGQYFRPNDKVVRVKADDEFNQFNYMKTTINGVTHTVNRTDCSDQGSYVLCDLQNLNLPEGTYTAVTTTYTRANNRVDNLTSQPFTIDNTRPVLSNFHITSTHAVYGSSVAVAADVTDNDRVNDVKFYVTAPRVGDGVCDGNGAHLADTTTTSPSSGSTYSGTLDTSSLNGDYCLNAIAGDVAANHSLPVATIKATFDNIAPVVAITAPNGGDTVHGTVTVSGTVTDVNPDHYYFVVKNSGGTVVAGPGTVNQATVSSWNWNTTSLPDGVYTVDLEARDAAGNKDASSTAVIHVTVDNNAPTGLVNVSPADGTVTTTAAQQQITWTEATDANGPVSYFYESSLSSATNLDGSFVSPAYQSGALSDHQIPTPGTPAGTYFWHVRAVDAVGNSTAWTGAWTIVVDNTAPTVTVDTRSTTDTTPTLTGAVDDSSATVKVTVNGHIYTATVTGNTWSANVTDALPVGSYDIVATATDAATNSGTDSTTNELKITAAPAVLGASTSNSNVTSTSSQNSSTQNTDNSDNGSAPEVLGDNTTTPNTTDNGTGNVKGDSTSTESGSKETKKAASNDNFLGLGWWWLLVLLALGFPLWILGKRRAAKDA